MKHNFNKYYISDFLDIQRKSFYTLLEKGIIEEFSKRNPISNTKKTMEVFFYPNFYQLTPPEYTPSQAIIKSKSYTAKLYIPVQLTQQDKSDITTVPIYKLPNKSFEYPNEQKWTKSLDLESFVAFKSQHFLTHSIHCNQLDNTHLLSGGKKEDLKLSRLKKKAAKTTKQNRSDLLPSQSQKSNIERCGVENLHAALQSSGKLSSRRDVFPVLKRIKPSLFNKLNIIIKLKWVYVGDIPLMTKRGHFILNGCARVIINQMIRSPGIYYQKKIYENFSNKWSEKPENSFIRYYADLICNRGTWLRIEMDKYNKIWAQMKRVPKIPMMWFLIAVGLTDKMVLKSIMDSKILLYNLDEDPLNPNKKILPYVKTPPAAWTKIYNIVFSKKKKKKKTPNKFKTTTSLQEIATKQQELNNNIEGKAEEGRNWIFNRFMNPRTYDLGKVGRVNFNNKLKLTIPFHVTTLTPQDFLAATNHLILVSKGLRELDDIDHLKNRRVRTSGELIQTQIGIGLVRLEKTIREKMLFHLTKSSLKPKEINLPSSEPREARLKKGRAMPASKQKELFAGISKKKNKSTFQNNYWINIHNIVNTKPLNGALREFFGTNPLSQFMDQINPLAELTHKRRLSSMGPGGVTRDSATLAIRGIHPSHYGRICPVETPEGKNTGLVNSLTAYARVNADGYIETPFYRVYKGQVQKKIGLYFFSAKQEETIKLAAADLYTSDIGFLPNASIPVRIIEDFTKIGRNDIQYVGVAAIQMISIATSLIPFFEHDDANRALMGSNMQRQAVSILKPQRPIVGTGLEARAVSDSGHVVTAKYSGLVTYMSSKKIVIYTWGDFYRQEKTTLVF